MSCTCLHERQPHALVHQSKCSARPSRVSTCYTGEGKETAATRTGGEGNADASCCKTCQHAASPRSDIASQLDSKLGCSLPRHTQPATMDTANRVTCTTIATTTRLRASPYARRQRTLAAARLCSWLHYLSCMVVVKVNAVAPVRPPAATRAVNAGQSLATCTVIRRSAELVSGVL